MNDEERSIYYADPDNRKPASPGRRLGRKALTAHVPIRFRPEIIAEVKRIAEEDRKTVSSWIRDVVEAEVERRRPRYPLSKAVHESRIDISGFDEPANDRTKTDRQLVEAAN